MKKQNQNPVLTSFRYSFCSEETYPGPWFSRESFQVIHFVDSGPAFCREKYRGHSSPTPLSAVVSMSHHNSTIYYMRLLLQAGERTIFDWCPLPEGNRLLSSCLLSFLVFPCFEFNFDGHVIGCMSTHITMYSAFFHRSWAHALSFSLIGAISIVMLARDVFHSSHHVTCPVLP